MPDNITEETAASPEISTSVPATENVAEQAPETSAPKPQASLAEAALESSLSDVLPLSPIGGESEKNTSGKPEKKNGRHGLRRGASAKKGKTGASGASVGVIENPEQFTETLSGTGPKPRDRRDTRPQENTVAEANVENASAGEAVEEKIEEIRQGAGWRIREKREKHFRVQANAGTPRPKLIIEPAPIPVQEDEPSFWQKLKNRILAFFKIGKKKKKNQRGKKRNGKFRGDRPQGKKDFHGQRHGGKKNFNRNRNSGFRGNNGNRNRQQNKDSV